ncbi:MAG: UbiA family prenyltransferase [Candidatus Dormibacteria bacterium]
MASLFDERRPGGRLRGLFFLTHPGPSLLVTAVTMAAVALLERRHPAGGDVARAGLLMLGAQVAIGSLNDVAGVGHDRLAKPFKPLVRGQISRRAALAVGLVGVAASLAIAATWGAAELLAAAAGLGSGLAYDLWAKSSPLSVLCWWCGFAALALLVTVVSGAGDLGTTLALVVLVATALQLSNGLADASADARSATPTLAGMLGASGSRLAIVVALVSAALLAATAALQHAAGGAALAAATLLAGTAAAALTLRPRMLFAVTAVLVAAAAVAWFASLPLAPG